jgi:hypothetical protein
VYKNAGTKKQPCVLYIGTYGSYSLASKAVGMTPHENKGKPKKIKGVLTGERGVPTFEYREAAAQVRGTTKGPHKNGAKEPELHYFIFAYQAAGLARDLAGDTEAEQEQSDAVIEKLEKRKENNEEAALKLKEVQALKKLEVQALKKLEVQALKKLEVKKRKTHEGSTSAPSKKGKRGSE